MKKNVIAPNNDYVEEEDYETTDVVPVSNDAAIEEEKQLIQAETEVVKTFNVIAQGVAQECIRYKQEKQRFQEEMIKLDKECNRGIRTMKENFKIKKNFIDENLQLLDSFRNQLNQFDVVNLTDTQAKIYTTLIDNISVLVSETSALYNGIL